MLDLVFYIFVLIMIWIDFQVKSTISAIHMHFNDALTVCPLITMEVVRKVLSPFCEFNLCSSSESCIAWAAHLSGNGSW